MARSIHVYVVACAWTDAPAGAFTVKHELVTWLRRQPELDGLRVYRIPDGLNQSREPVELDVWELGAKA